MKEMNDAIIEHIQHRDNIEDKVTQYCRRRIDRTLKKIDLSDAATVADVAAKYANKTSALDVQAIADVRRQSINSCM